jgi:hypothetical protein
MNPTDPDKSELALGNNPMDVRVRWRSSSNQSDTELRLAKEYWLETIQPYIAGRKLQGVEFFIAQEAHEWLRMMTNLATHWNNSDAGKKAPIPAEDFPEWEKPEFQKPEELYADPTVKPETLAGIAASLSNKGDVKMNPDEAVRHAHDMLTSAKKYVASLPKKQGTGTLPEIVELPFSKVTFDEIEQSNGKNSARLPLLPPVQKRRNEGIMKPQAIKDAVKDYLAEYNPTKIISPQIPKQEYERTEKEWELRLKKSQEDKAAGIDSGTPFKLGHGKKMTYSDWQKQNLDSIAECLENRQITYRILGTMRWERFKKHWLDQRSRTEKAKLTKSKKTTATGRQKR